MSDVALTNAETEQKQLVDRKKILLAELVEIEDRLGQINRFIKAWHAFAGTEPNVPVDNQSDSEGNKAASIHTPRGKRPKNSSKESVANLALEIIRERQEPVSRSDLYSELVRRGLTIEGKDPEMVQSTMLWRMRDQVARLKTGGYWLAGKDWPDADYLPETLGQMDLKVDL